MVRLMDIDGIYSLVHDDLFMFLCIRISCANHWITHQSGELNEVSDP